MKEIVLAINTCTPRQGIAILKKQSLLREVTWTSGIVQGLDRPYRSQLAEEIERMCKIEEISWEEVALLAVTVGPGSFTGIRSGLSFVKGLAFAREIPVAPCTTLEALALQANGALICPILDARRGELYWGLYRKGEKLEIEIPPTLSHPLHLQKILTQRDESITLLGDPLWQDDLLSLFSRPPFCLSPAQCWTLRASSVGVLAWELYEKGSVRNASEVLPLYLRTAL